MIKSGVTPTKKDHRRYSAHRTFGGTQVFLSEYNLDAGLTMPDQVDDGYPNGCTGYAQAELCQDEDKAQYKPSFTYLKSIFMADVLNGQPVDMETSLKSTKVYGVQGVNETTDEQATSHRRGAYYQIENQSDWFDSIRSTITINKCSVSVATQWFPEFEPVGNGNGKLLSDGIITMPNLKSTGFSWHDWKVCGWKVINGVTYLIGKSWQGKSYGDNGWCYFSREIINKLLETSGAGAFIVAPYDPSKVQTVKLDIISLLISYCRRLIAQLII